jgi:DNA-binding NtrC family response regulator
MPTGIVMFLGSCGGGRPALETVVEEFGWSLEIAATFEELGDRSARQNIVVMLLDPTSLGLSPSETLHSALEAAPRARRVLCHHFSDTLSMPEMAEEGAFQTLPLPLDHAEVRQCLGFVWAAERRKPSNVVSLDDHTPSRRKSASAAAKMPPKASGTVA